MRGEHHGALKVAVTQVAEKGKANKALIAVLAKKLDLRRSQLTLHAGPTSADKQFLVSGISRAGSGRGALPRRVDKSSE